MKTQAGKQNGEVWDSKAVAQLIQNKGWYKTFRVYFQQIYLWGFTSQCPCGFPQDWIKALFASGEFETCQTVEVLVPGDKGRDQTSLLHQQSRGPPERNEGLFLLKPLLYLVVHAWNCIRKIMKWLMWPFLGREIESGFVTDSFYDVYKWDQSLGRSDQVSKVLVLNKH